MKQLKHIAILLIAGVFLLNPTYAQDRCATDELPVNKQESVERFEQWMKTQVNSTNNLYGIYGQNRVNNIFQIPVVVHIIHNGEAIGSGSNLSEAQIISQIEVLNEDFRRLNADTINTPSVFKPVAADSEIEFVLAAQDPDGLPTDGIVRVKGSKTSYHPTNDQSTLSSDSYWPAEDYFNIWVVNLQNPYIGYAQFPVSTLPGLESQNDNRLTDGVVIHYRAFGSKEKDPNANLDSRFNLGRTTTHEVGHFLGLRHIWGDGNCNVDDYCSDTPLAGKSNSGYDGPCSFPGPNSCGSGSNDLPDMFQNYMDYSDDVCMNLFTHDQKGRMDVVLSESPRRASLLNSPGLQEPVLAPLDLEIKQVLNPVVGVCGDEVTPQLVIRNYGENTIVSATIDLFINNTLFEALELNDLMLSTYESDTIIFGTHTIPSTSGEPYFVFQITEVNNTSDHSRGNAAAVTVPLLQVQSLPFIEDFESFSTDDWQTYNPDNGYTWTIKNAPFATNTNKAIATSFFDDDSPGTEDHLISQPFYLPSNSPAMLAFDVAYARYKDEDFEGLKIVLSTDCGNSYPYVIFEKYGEDLETTDPQTTEFSPGGIQHWRKEIVNLSGFAGNNVRLAFIAVNEWGNNLYLDNISVLDEEIIDIELTEITSPTPAQCDHEIQPALLITNTGKMSISSLELEMVLNGIATNYLFQFTDSLKQDEKIMLQIPSLNVQEGMNTISFRLIAVNESSIDHFEYNNFLSREFLIDDTREIVPLRENFDDFNNSNWHILNVDSELTWVLTSNSNNNKIASFPSAQYLNQKDEDWIVSPVMDFSNVNEAAFFFDLAYSGETPERLQVFYTVDCGETYLPLNFDKEGIQLNTYPSGQAKIFVRQYVSLEEVIGHNDVRLAIVATSGQGNNIEIDNIEIFLTDESSPIVPSGQVAIFPNPANGPVKLSFNLEAMEDIQVLILDNLGREKALYRLPFTLNQTHTIDMSAQPDGIYYIKIRGQTFQTTKRLVIY